MKMKTYVAFDNIAFECNIIMLLPIKSIEKLTSTLNKTKPVSYTHLDVYKRQPFPFAILDLISSLFKLSSFNKIVPGR